MCSACESPGKLRGRAFQEPNSEAGMLDNPHFELTVPQQKHTAADTVRFLRTLANARRKPLKFSWLGRLGTNLLGRPCKCISTENDCDEAAAEHSFVSGHVRCLGCI